MDDESAEGRMTTHSVNIVEADLSKLEHQNAVVQMMNAYASDPFGDGKPLPPQVLENLAHGLRNHPTTLIFLAFRENTPIGIAVCFRGFSTFAAAPLINISDFYVDPKARGHGIGRKLLEAVEREAVSSGCCKITLEVQENNQRARHIYSEFGFSQAVYVAEAGGSLALSKALIQK